MQAKMNSLTSEIAQLRAMKKSSGNKGNLRPSTMRAPRRRNRQAVRGYDASAGQGERAFVASAYATSQRTGQAQIFRNSVNSCRIIHRELIANVTGTVAFTVAQTFACNPGMAATFPWLSNEAAGWERYRFNKLCFKYFTRTGSNIPGSVMLSPDYDAADAAPVAEQIASSAQDTVEDAPWKDIVCELKVSEMFDDQPHKTIRSGTLAANQDIKTYDAANLNLCTVDGTAVAWGKLWVEYDVTLVTPQVPSGGFQAEGSLLGTGAMAAATPFGTTPTPTGPIILAANATNVLSISNVQPGQRIGIAVGIAGTVLSDITYVGPTGMTAVVFAAGANAGATSSAAYGTFTVTANNPSVTITFTATTVTTSFLTVVVLAPLPGF